MNCSKIIFTSEGTSPLLNQQLDTIFTIENYKKYSFKILTCLESLCNVRELKLCIFFRLTQVRETISCPQSKPVVIQLASDDSFSQYAEYFFFVCVLSIIYCIVSLVIYTKCTQAYETNDRYPLGVSKC